MKKLILILAIALAFISCRKMDQYEIIRGKYQIDEPNKDQKFEFNFKKNGELIIENIVGDDESYSVTSKYVYHFKVLSDDKIEIGGYDYQYNIERLWGKNYLYINDNGFTVWKLKKL